MNLFALSGLFTGFFSIFFGIFVYLKDRKNRMHFVFLLFAITVSMWGFGVYKIGLAQSAAVGLFWWRTAYLGVIWIPVFLLHFTYIFLEIKTRKMVWFAYLYGFFYLTISYSGLFMQKVEFKFSSIYYLVSSGFFYPLFAFLWFFIVIYAHYELYKEMKKSVGLKRAQIKYFFLAMGIGFAGGGTCYLPIFNINIYPIMNFTIPLYPAIMSYAIVRHRLMDIRLALKRSVVYGISFFTILILLLIGRYVLNLFIPNRILIGDIIMLTLMVFIYPLVRDFYNHFATKYFFSSLYNPQEVIQNFNDELKRTINVERVYAIVESVFANILHAKNILTMSKTSLRYIALDQEQEKREIPISSILQQGLAFFSKRYNQEKSILIATELKKEKYEDLESLGKMLADNNFELVLPLVGLDENLGYIFVGAKESGDMYSKEDVQLLEIVGTQAAIALQNAFLYVETVHSYEVEKKARAELESLDEAKTSFILTTQHHLRTPLTIVRGVLDSLGKKREGEGLSNVDVLFIQKGNTATNTLAKLVNEFLDIAQMDVGKSILNKKRYILHAIIQGILEEISHWVESKHLTIKTICSDDAQKIELDIDIQKMRDALLNVIDNAVKYTPKDGTIVIEEIIERRGEDRVYKIIISDTGIGMTTEEQEKVFIRSFERGKKAKEVNATGRGIGLMLAKQIIKIHGGSIYVKSGGRDMGSTFIIEIPVKEDGS